jgi:hypothetical protein
MNAIQASTALQSYLTRRNRTKVCPALEQMDRSVSRLQNLLHRYPFLFKTLCLARGKTTVEAIEQLQATTQQRFERQLSRHVIAQMQATKQTVPNPTSISQFGLQIALDRFTGHVWGRETHRNLADRFLRQARQESFATFKRNLYSYLMASIPNNASSQGFSHQLHQSLEQFLADQNNQQLNTFLLTATCRHLFKFLIVEGGHNLDHSRLLHLAHSSNPFTIAELCLRILLLCPKSQCHLDKRLALLFQHYSAQAPAEVNWLIQLLEYMNLAYATQFGQVKLPHWQRSPQTAPPQTASPQTASPQTHASQTHTQLESLPMVA